MDEKTIVTRGGVATIEWCRTQGRTSKESRKPGRGPEENQPSFLSLFQDPKSALAAVAGNWLFGCQGGAESSAR
jgi:hypothetical protein